MFLYLIRHGDPDYENDCLTDLGRRQAQLVGERLSHEGITEIFSSPMGRARETAAPLAKLLGLSIGIEDWAHEIDVTTGGEGQGFSERLCVNTPTYLLRADEMLRRGDRFFEDALFEGTPAEEQIRTVTQGADHFLERLGLLREGALYREVPSVDGKHPHERVVALFCHGGMGVTLLGHLCGIPAPLAWANAMFDTTGVTKLWFQEYGEAPLTSPRVIYQNSTCHLKEERT